MDFDVLNEIERRFKGKKTARITEKEFAEINMIFIKFISSNNELIRSMLDVLTYRLGVEFDRFHLRHIPYKALIRSGSVKELKLLMLTLEFKGKKVFEMEGGCTGNMLNDLTLLFDGLVNSNLIAGNSHEKIDFSMEGHMKC